MPVYWANGKYPDRSERDVHPLGLPTFTPSMTTCTVPPPVGSARRVPGASTQPKLLITPATVCPCEGVSMAPKGMVALALLTVIALVPSGVEWPSPSSA